MDTPGPGRCRLCHSERSDRAAGRAAGANQSVAMLVSRTLSMETTLGLRGGIQPCLARSPTMASGWGPAIESAVREPWPSCNTESAQTSMPGKAKNFSIPDVRMKCGRAAGPLRVANPSRSQCDGSISFRALLRGHVASVTALPRPAEVCVMPRTPGPRSRPLVAFTTTLGVG